MRTLNKRFPLTAILALAIALLALLSIYGVLPTQSVSRERFYVKEFPYRAIAACQKNQSECLVVVGKGEQGWRGSQLDAALSTAGGWFNLVSDVPEPLKPQMELLRLTSDGRPSASVNVERREMSGLDIAGELIADGDSLFYVSNYGDAYEDDEDEMEGETAEGVDEDSPSFTARGWRWDGQSFSPIPAEQAKQLAERVLKERRQRARLQMSGRARGKDVADSKQVPDSDNASAGGWEVYDEHIALMDGYPSRYSAFKLASADWRLRFKYEGNPAKPTEGAATLELVRASSSSLAASSRYGERDLARYGDKWEQINAARYEMMRNRQMPAFASSYYGRHFQPVGIFQLSLFFVFLTIPYWTLRHALNRSSSSTNFYPDARPENFPALDRAALDRYTHDLEAQGFVHLRDYAVTPASSKILLPSFGRLFVNPTLNCFAEVGQIFTVKKNPLYSGMRCSISSHFSDRRTFATTDREIGSISYALRRPQNLWSARPGASIAQLIAWHLEVRREIELVLDIRVSANLTSESFFAQVTESIGHQRAVLRRRTRLLLPLLIEDARLKYRKRYDWLGDYGITPAPAGWIPPVSAETASANGRPSSKGQMLLSNWSGIIGFASGVALNLSLYFWLLQPTHQRGGLLFRAGLSVFGLLGFVLLKIANRQQG